MLYFDFYIKCNLSNCNGVKSKFGVHFLISMVNLERKTIRNVN